MKNITGSKLTPDFIKPPRRERKKWKLKKIPRGFFKNLQTPRMKEIVDSLDWPENVKKTMGRLDKIDRKNNVLVIDGKLDPVHIVCIITHKNSHLIKNISFTQKIFSYPEFKYSISYYIKEFEKMFGTSPPEEVIEFSYLMNLFGETYKGLLFDESPPDDLIGMLISFCCLSIFSDKEYIRSIFKHLTFNLGYFPLFFDRETGENKGFVFDMLHNCFTSFASDYCYSIILDEYLWDVLEGYILCAESDAVSLCGTIESNFKSNSGKFEKLDYKDVLSKFDYIGQEEILSWLIHLLITSYFDNVPMRKLKFQGENNLRYKEFLNKIEQESLSKNYNYIIAGTCPKIVISIKDHFHPLFTYDHLHDLFKMFEYKGNKFDLDQFLSKNYPMTDFYISIDKKNYVKNFISDELFSSFYRSVVNFAEKECDEERYGFALVLGYLLWNWTVEDYSVSDTSDDVVRLFGKIPDSYCHPLIKAEAKEHAYTRKNNEK